MSDPYRVETTPHFERDFKKLDPQMKRRVMKKVELLGDHPELLTHTLQGLPADLSGLQKYRVGDYRILLWVDHTHRVITLYKVGHRSAIYKSL